MYHSAPATRFNYISPSSRSNYQLRDLARQQTLQTSFIENGNGNHQRALQQQQQRHKGGGGDGTVIENTIGLGLNGEMASDLQHQYLNDQGYKEAQAVSTRRGDTVRNTNNQNKIP